MCCYFWLDKCIGRIAKQILLSELVAHIHSVSRTLKCHTYVATGASGVCLAGQVGDYSSILLQNDLSHKPGDSFSQILRDLDLHNQV